MELANEAVGREEVLVEESVTLPENSADPVVYQLVRVDGNGRLVPATQDEVMVLEDSLDDDKTKDKIVLSARKTLECTDQTEGFEYEVQLGDVEIFPKKPNDPTNSTVVFENVDHPIKQEMISLSAPHADAVSHFRFGNPEGCSKLLGGLNENGSSTSALGVGLKPNFSLLKGQINLENLPVKELQETFRATFGRETAVKDKRWLKRRIIMGLTNSCDFSTTTFVIMNDTVLKQGTKGTDKIVDDSVLVDCVVHSEMEIPLNCDAKQNEIGSHVSGIKDEFTTTQINCGGTDADSEQRSAKRVRKPTRRYIEELSEVESRESEGKIVVLTKYPECNLSSTKFCSNPDQHHDLAQGRLTRKDSLGGSGVQVPYVSRVRRSRPRENLTSLTEFQPSCMSMPSRRVKNDVAASSEEVDNGIQDNVINDGLLSRSSHEPICQAHTEHENSQMEKKIETENVDLGNDDEVVTVLTANGGLRRKHHRPWTLSEVVNLVEGVAKYGAGRWSEIKRLAFTSYSYRTSVDLKDKWRNLLRASLTELPAGNEMHSSRKHGSILIPAGILSRVRELADA